MENIISKDKAYKSWLEELKKRIQTSQIKAAIKVNTELLDLYWELGHEIVLKQKESNWGDAIIDQLSKDLTASFPGMKGFSKRNLFYIRQWYLFYSQGQTKVPQLVAQLDGGNKSLPLPEIMPQLVAQIPWGHNREIISKCKDIKEAIFYVQQTITNNWSRAVLVAQIETKLYQRQGKAIHNFEVTLPAPKVHRRTGTLATDDKGLHSQLVHVDRDDFEFDPFNKQGALSKMWQLFCEQTERIIELNKRLVA